MLYFYFPLQFYNFNNILFYLILFLDKKVTTYSLHPGVIQTELGRHIDSVYFKGARQLASTLGYFFYKTVEQGAQTTLYCALEESIASQTGLYYR